MSILLLNALVAIILLTVLFSLWGIVHLLAGRRFGSRQLSCKGPRRNEAGEMMCCHEEKLCESAAEQGEEAASPPHS